MPSTFIEKLENRRLSLGIPITLLAKRSRVSIATANRILRGDHSKTSFANVMAIAEALGLEVEVMPIPDFERTHARKKAERLIRSVQGTMGLEAAALGKKAVEEMVQDATAKLLNGSKRRLWG